MQEFDKQMILQVKLGVLHLLDAYMPPYQGNSGEIKGKKLAFMALVAFI